MTKYAVVDIGTNSARLMIAHVKNQQVISDFKTLRTIRVGEGLHDNLGITEAAMQRTKDALTEFLEISRIHGADEFYCFATSAVRDAHNQKEFVEYIKQQCSVTIEVISGDSEASLGFAGSINGYGGMFDIGGGSTEIMTGTLHKVEFQHSFQIGTVRSLQMFPAADNADEGAYKNAHRLAAETFKGIPRSNGFTYVGIGGTATALAAIDLQLEEYSAARVQGHVISHQRMTELCDMLKSKTKQQRKELIGLEEKRADVIVFGAIIMLELMNAAKAIEVRVSDSDNQEGYLALKLGLSSR